MFAAVSELHFAAAHFYSLLYAFLVSRLYAMYNSIPRLFWDVCYVPYHYLLKVTIVSNPVFQCHHFTPMSLGDRRPIWVSKYRLDI